ncbi:MAG: hypothetical protein J5595_06260 [Bacteroidales bacterium]|nr:hypothetical protein [Bacteroidales bacterium]
MKVDINFTTLSDAFAALMLAAGGAEVHLDVPQSLWQLRGGLIMCRFLEEGIFGGNDGAKGLFDYRQLTSAAEALHSISPNTVYPEVVYAVQDRNFLRDFANHFRNKAYRDISRPDGDVQVLREGVSLKPGKVLRCAPAYRINYQRLVVAMLRTLRNLGGSYTLGGSVAIDNKNTVDYQYYRLDASMSPTVWKSVYLPGGVWLYSRSNDFYILAKSGVDVVAALSEVFDGFQLPEGALQNPLEINLSDLDLPFEALLTASQKYDFDLLKLPTLDGGNFEFSPSMADVVCYADYYFDMVKRLDINVNEFRDAVFDYGTHIEEIVNDTYDLYPEYHNGVKSFRAAVQRWKDL